MIEGKYWFLFVLALVWIIFASIQDIRKKEVANWLNYSLLVFALAYRGFYSIANLDYWFFVYGALGAIAFAIIANIFYYSKIFGGGDARLLIGLGAVLPFESLRGMFFEGIMFLLLLFILGAVYSIICSFFIIGKNFAKFKIEFKKKIRILYVLYPMVIILIVAIRHTIDYSNLLYYIYGLLLILPLLYVYLLALDKCMIKLVYPRELQEGDWLDREVKVRGKIIRKSVHGLSLEDIRLLRKAGKKVAIKEGVVFVPVFLISFVVYLYIISKYGSMTDYLLRFLM